MVNPKRVEKKLPLLITDGPSFSWEYDCKEVRVNKFKRGQPERYLFHRQELIKKLEEINRDVEEYHKICKANRKLNH